MTAILAIALIFLGFAALDIIWPQGQPRFVYVLRFWLAMLVTGLFVATLVLSRSGAVSGVFGLISATPAVLLAWRANHGRVRRRALIAASLIAAAVFFLAAAQTQPELQLRGDEHPFLLLAGGALVASLIAVILPPYAGRKMGRGRVFGILLAAFPLPLFMTSWLGAVLWIEREAQLVYPDRAYCLAQPNNVQRRHALALTPGAVIFGVNYQGYTRTRVLLGPEGGKWTHHFSVNEGTFLPNTSPAFLFDAPRRPNC